MKNFFESIVVRFFLILITLTIAQQSMAAEIGASDNLLSLDVHGFVSQGFIVTSENNYLMNSKRGSFEFTEVGLNFTKPLTENLRMGVQLFARKLGTVGNFNVKADWFYLDYKFSDEIGLRAGRVKLPFGLYNDTSDIDAARVPILLPQSIYPTASRDYLLAQTGMELYGRLDLSSVGTLDYRFYGGAINVDIPSQTETPIKILYLDNPYVVGGRLLWETPLEGLRIGGSLQALRLDTHLLFPTSPTSVSVNIPVVLTAGSIEYSLHDLLVAAEYSRWYVSANSHDQTILPSIPTMVSERGYLMTSYRFSKWFDPGVYYSVYYPDTDNHSGRKNKQYDLAGSLRFDINPYWLVKFEGHYMHGTAGLDPVLNNNMSLNSLNDDWAIFLIKTTVYF